MRQMMEGLPKEIVWEIMKDTDLETTRSLAFSHSHFTWLLSDHDRLMRAFTRRVFCWDHVGYRFAGRLHRSDGPAIEWANGTKEWFVNGKRHRLDGPAHEWPDGTKDWYLNGKLHRVDGPAIEWANGGKEWWVNGELHRVDGPAMEWPDGTKEWWVDGKRMK